MGCLKLTYQDGPGEIFSFHRNNTMVENPVYQILDVKRNHLGNVLTVISDKKLPIDQNSDGTVDAYSAAIVSVTDYYAFGAPMPGRTFNADTYRYGAANGQEKVDEISGSGNHYVAKFWQYDPRIGRRWNLDPKPQISISDYACFQNNPIFVMDPFGDKPKPKEAALMAKHVYGGMSDDKLKGGWKPSEIKVKDVEDDDPKSGLKGHLYERTRKGVTEYAYVYAGTEDVSKDGWEDVLQAFGTSKQYDIAATNATNLDNYFGSKELTFVGHSLGGGLSNLSALKTDRSSITFNPAWLSKATMLKHGVYTKSDEKITNYIIAGEILDVSQRAITAGSSLFGLIESRGTNKYLFSLSALMSAKGMINAHKIESVIKEIEDVDEYNKVWDKNKGKWVVD